MTHLRLEPGNHLKEKKMGEEEMHKWDGERKRRSILRRGKKGLYRVNSNKGIMKVISN